MVVCPPISGVSAISRWRDPPLSPSTRLALGTNPVLELVALTARSELEVRSSETVNRTLTTASSSTVRSGRGDIVGGLLAGPTIVITKVCSALSWVPPLASPPLSRSRTRTSAVPNFPGLGVKVRAPLGWMEGATRNNKGLSTVTSNWTFWVASLDGPARMSLAHAVIHCAPWVSKTVRSTPLVNVGASLTGMTGRVREAMLVCAPPAPVLPKSLTARVTRAVP